MAITCKLSLQLSALFNLQLLNLCTLQYLISDLGRLLIFDNLPHLVALITFWSLINFKDLVRLVGYYIWSAIKFWLYPSPEKFICKDLFIGKTKYFLYLKKIIQNNLNIHFIHFFSHKGPKVIFEWKVKDT